MRLLICGDRNWNNWGLIEEWLRVWKSKVWILIHGDCAGADRIAARIAEELGITTIPFPAQWDRYGKAAGPIRNEQMINAEPDEVWAFHNEWDKSKGTKNMVGLALGRGIPVTLISEQNPLGVKL